jgi:hypothetical protein
VIIQANFQAVPYDSGYVKKGVLIGTEGPFRNLN